MPNEGCDDNFITSSLDQCLLACPPASSTPPSSSTDVTSLLLTSSSVESSPLKMCSCGQLDCSECLFGGKETFLKMPCADGSSCNHDHSASLWMTGEI